MAWHFCSKTSTNKMEKIQERALRFIYDDQDSAYEELLHKANLPSLEIRRLRTMAIECFKIIHDLSPPCLSNLVSRRESTYSFRYTNILDIPRVRTVTYGKKSFRFAVPLLWNDLPEHFRAQTNFLQFKSLISSWNGKVCKCSACSAWYMCNLLFFGLFSLHVINWLFNFTLLCSCLDALVMFSLVLCILLLCTCFINLYRIYYIYNAFMLLLDIAI